MGHLNTWQAVDRPTSATFPNVQLICQTCTQALRVWLGYSVWLMTAGRSERINGPLCVSESAFLCFVSVDGAVGDCGWRPAVGVCWCGRVGGGTCATSVRRAEWIQQFTVGRTSVWPSQCFGAEEINILFIILSNILYSDHRWLKMYKHLWFPSPSFPIFTHLSYVGCGRGTESCAN